MDTAGTYPDFGPDQIAHNQPTGDAVSPYDDGSPRIQRPLFYQSSPLQHSPPLSHDPTSGGSQELSGVGAHISLHPGIITPNPLESNVGRDALLAYAHRLYESPGRPGPSGLSATPVFNLPNTTSSSEHEYQSQLLPIITMLRSLHPRHIPTLLLLGSVHFAMGDMSSSLAINHEILSLDPNYASCSLRFFSIAQLICQGRGNV